VFSYFGCVLDGEEFTNSYTNVKYFFKKTFPLTFIYAKCRVTSFVLEAIEDPAPRADTNATSYLKPVHVAAGAGFVNSVERAYGSLTIKFVTHKPIVLKFGEQWVNTSGAEMVL
jgi:hypothetical protein